MSCASVNYKALGVGKGLCELNNMTFQETSQADRRDSPEFNLHLDIIKQVKVTNIILYSWNQTRNTRLALHV